jgi:uncharacterized membrane protein YkvA (DUF1232 family)
LLSPGNAKSVQLSNAPMSMKKKSAGRTAETSGDPLRQFLTDQTNHRLTTAEYVAQGVAQVGPQQVEQVEAELPELRKRIAQITDSRRLRSRLEVLAQFLAESGNGTAAAPEARRDAAFALAYFSHGSERIPNETPEYGLLDDALVVEAVLERNSAALREHWHRAGRELPDPI